MFSYIFQLPPKIFKSDEQPKATPIKKNIGIINPKDLTAEQSKILGNFLLAQNNRIYFTAFESYEYAMLDEKKTEVVYEFQLSNSILSRKRKSDPSQHRFDIVSNSPFAILNKSTQRTVAVIDGTLVPLKDKTLKYKEKLRVLKTSELADVHIQNEFHLMDLLKYLNVKKVNHHLVMRLLDGRTLEKITTGSKDELSVADRLDITINCVRALIEVHAYHIIHRDIKPANIIIDPSCGYRASIIDFDCSFFKGEPIRLRNTGTLGARPYEQAVNSDTQDETTDVFALGRTLAYLWKLELVHIGKVTRNTEDELANLNHNSHYIRTQFDELPGLNQKQKDELQKLIFSMTMKEQAERINLQKVLEELETIRLTLRLTASPTELQEQITQGNKSAQFVYNKMLTIAHQPKLSESEKLTEYITLLTQQVQTLIQTQPAFNEFCSVLNLNDFINQSPNILLNYLGNLASLYTNSIYKLKGILQQCKDLQTKCNNDSEISNSIDLLEKNATASLLRDYRPATFAEFMEREKKLTQKVSHYSTQLANLIEKAELAKSQDIKLTTSP